jgi:hypothetical protein
MLAKQYGLAQYLMLYCVLTNGLKTSKLGENKIFWNIFP